MVFFKFSSNIPVVYTYRKYVLHILLQKVHILLQKAINQAITPLPPKKKLLGLQIIVFKDESLITDIFITVNNNNNN